MRPTSPSFLEFINAVVDGNVKLVSRRLSADPGLATMKLDRGATRENAAEFFIDAAMHYLYAGDTALHMAAAAFQPAVAALLVRHGSDCRTRNRRGAEPLHYAADANRWAPAAQRKTIECLLTAGADPNALDKSGVSPLHRAVRTRSSMAVDALLAGGADPRLRNGSGSTPLHLAVQDTGRGGADSTRARSEQEKVIALLVDAGARMTDRDGRGRTVLEASSGRLLGMLPQTIHR